jgi:transaldolase
VPPATLDAFRDHGVARATLGEGIDAARQVFGEIERLRLPLDAITAQLVDDGIRLFVEAHEKLLTAVAGKRDRLLQAAI